MEITFSQLKQKDVICLTDGRHLGRVFDLTFDTTENNVKGIFVTGCKGFKFTRQDVFIPMRDIVKIGEDAILVKLNKRKDDNEEDNSSDEKGAKHKRPKDSCCYDQRPPEPPFNPCQPNPPCPPNFSKNLSSRRNMEEYE